MGWLITVGQVTVVYNGLVVTKEQRRVVWYVV